MHWDLCRSGEAEAQNLGRDVPRSSHHPASAGLHHVQRLLHRHGGEPQGQPDTSEDSKAGAAAGLVCLVSRREIKVS